MIRATLGMLVVALCLVLSPVTIAQDSPITVNVNRTRFSTDELIILTVKVVDDSPQQPRPILPALDGLAVIDLDISTDVSIVNGKIRTEVTYTYRLQPRRTGFLVIPPVTVDIDGKIYRAAPVSIEVTQGAPPAPSKGNAVRPANITPPAGLAGQDFYVESQVDILKPYVGQQITYTFRFYQAIQLYRPPQYEAPLFTGFKSLGMPVQEYNLEIDDRAYLITEIRTALFPQTPGRTTIDAARLTFPGNFFEEPVEIYTEPVILDVQQLPGSAPVDFNGAVGQYEIRAWFSPQVAVVNQPSSLFVAVSGTGNIEALPEPVWQGLDDWRVYDSLSSLTTDMKDGLISGTRVYERLVVPDRVGDFTIPPARLVYFDPQVGQYKTISSQPVQVRIVPAPTPDPAAAAATATAMAATATPAAIAANSDTPPAEDQMVNPFLSGSRFFEVNIPLPLLLILSLGLCGTIPLAVAVGAGGFWLWQKRQRSQIPPPEHEEPLRLPSQRIHPVLAAAMKQSEDNFRTVSRALHRYLEDCLGYSVQGLTHTELARRLRQRGLQESLITRLNDCLAESETGRYGPVTADAGWSLMETTEELLRDLDKFFKPENKTV